MIDHPDESQVTPEHIVAPHRARTIERMRAHDTVLCIQDGTDLNFATRPGCEGLSIIGRNQTAAKTLGLHLHLTLAVSGAGLPLGVLRCGFDEQPPPVEATSEQDSGSDDEAPSSPTDTEPDANDSAHKTRRWLDGLHDVAEAASELPRKTRVISVMDREADFFELFDAQRRTGRVDVLVRAKHDRRLGQGLPKLFDALRNAPADGHVEMDIARVSERPKTSRKPARPARTARIARAEVHYRELSLPSTLEGCAPVTLWAVHVRETAPPEGEKPIEWFLLTSVRVERIEAALEAIEHYLRRWRVEDFFRVLKSGCRAEHLGFHSAERLERALAIQCIIAWRLMLMTLLGREVPECDAELLFSDIELRFLADYAADAALPAPRNLAGAVLLVALLGGYQNRKHDPPPGHQIMWRGYERLSLATLGYRIAEKRSRAAD
ncbi:MAG: IS4 family transposase [Chromatiales bacterium]|nr:IS4 family transposase [Chromatiales bacterium]